jgi:hypothetical protein
MSMSSSANVFAYITTSASHRRRSPNASPPHTSGTAKSAKQTRAIALGGGRAEKLSRGRSPLPIRGLRGNWHWKRTSHRAEMRCRRWGHPEVSVSRLTLLLQLIECSGIRRSTTSATGSTSGGTVDVVGERTSVVSDQGNAEGAGGQTDAVQVEGEGQGKSRR